MTDAVQFPVLCIPARLGLYAAATRQALGRCTASLYWRAKVYEGMRVIDRTGRAFAVDGCRVRHPASGIGQALARVFDTTVRVELNLRPIAAIPIAQVEAAVRAAIADDPESFEELSGRPVTWWNETLASARSVQEIVDAILPAAGT